MREAAAFAGDEVDRAGGQRAAGSEQRLVDGGGDLELATARGHGPHAGRHRRIRDAR